MRRRSKLGTAESWREFAFALGIAEDALVHATVCAKRLLPAKESARVSALARQADDLRFAAQRTQQERVFEETEAVGAPSPNGVNGDG